MVGSVHLHGPFLCSSWLCFLLNTVLLLLLIFELEGGYFLLDLLHHCCLRLLLLSGIWLGLWDLLSFLDLLRGLRLFNFGFLVINLHLCGALLFGLLGIGCCAGVCGGRHGHVGGGLVCGLLRGWLFNNCGCLGLGLGCGFALLHGHE